MPDILSVALAQLNPAVGDLEGNASRLIDARQKAGKAGAHLLMTPELFLSGYPPEDLVLKPSFIEASLKQIERLRQITSDGGPGILLGTPYPEDGRLFNAVLLIDDGEIKGKSFKSDLPNYGPFDEKRVFAAAPFPTPLNFRGFHLGVVICEDMWTAPASRAVKERGAEIILVPNGSPFEVTKHQDRTALAEKRASETELPLLYLNRIGGQDELVFDGESFGIDAAGELRFRAKAWQEDMPIVHLERQENGLTIKAGAVEPAIRGDGAIYHALMIGLRDYVERNGFKGIVLGLSGGIDSALAAVIAADAIGPEKLHAVMLPSPFTSQASTDDAVAIARSLGCRLSTVPIGSSIETIGKTLGPLFRGRASDTTEENIQSRCRGLILMALSNKFGEMVLSTGNKSEMSVGYATLYGDMCGGFASLKDLYKTEVYKVARWRNANRPGSALAPGGILIPEQVFQKAPTAELRENQTDQDTLPAYETLDAILERMIERDLGLEAIVEEGFDRDTVVRIWSLMDRAEYKRRQAPPGTKITRRLHGRDRRYPITNSYRETSRS